MAKRIGELLVEARILSQSQLEQALFAQRKDGRKLGQVLIELGLATETQLTQTLSRQLSVPWVSLYHVDFSRSLLNLVPRELAERYTLVPILVRRVKKHGDTLYVAMDDPTNEGAIEELCAAASMPVKPMIACPSDIRSAIRVYYRGETADARASEASIGAGPDPAAPRGHLRRSASARADPPGGGPSAGDRGAAPASVGPQDSSAAQTRDSADAAPDVRFRVREVTTPRRASPKMIALTLLDGTQIAIPAPARAAKHEAGAGAGNELSDQLTARDLVTALRAVVDGADASEILGINPRWEALFATLLSILLRKGIVADWEFIEELRKI